METFTVLVRDGCHISQEKSKWDGRKWSFNDMLQRCSPRHRIRTVDTPWILRSVIIFCFSQSCCTRLKTRPRLLFRKHSIYFWTRVLKTLFYLRTDENAFFYWASLMSGNVCFKQSNPSPCLFMAFTDILINPIFIWNGGKYIFVLLTKILCVICFLPRSISPRSGHCFTW